MRGRRKGELSTPLKKQTIGPGTTSQVLSSWTLRPDARQLRCSISPLCPHRYSTLPGLPIVDIPFRSWSPPQPIPAPFSLAPSRLAPVAISSTSYFLALSPSATTRLSSSHLTPFPFSLPSLCRLRRSLHWGLLLHSLLGLAFFTPCPPLLHPLFVCVIFFSTSNFVLLPKISRLRTFLLSN
ncbi:hypothetical protein F5884DRAFT_10439 [Xylogone sp. PMI_703]|nr:hypothetical protein F5884DRAFT_10439 [Xylogone sp. PMI_703]